MTILSSYTSCSDNYAKGTNANMRLLLLNNPVHHINLIHPVQTKEITEIIDELNEILAA